MKKINLKEDLKEARDRKGLTQAMLAKKAGITDIAISLIENGKVTPQVKTRRRIEKVLGEPVNWLKTRGLRNWREGVMTSWESVEQTFRKALFEIKGLSNKERKEFIKLAKQYLKEFSEELEVAR